MRVANPRYQSLDLEPAWPSEGPQHAPICEDRFVTNNALELRRKRIKEGTEDGAAIGFMAGCTLSVTGIPLVVTLILNGQGKLSQKRAKALIDIFTPIALPGLFTGGVGAGLGAFFGNIKARVKNRH